MCLKTTTIDFDALERNPLEKAFFLIRLKNICARLPCKLYKTKKGIHVYIYKPMDFNTRLVIRALLLDDPMRLEIDVKRHENGLHGWEETLFNSKCQKQYCYEEKEIDLKDLEHYLFIKLSPIFFNE